MATLLTFIGRGTADKSGGSGRYKLASYCMPDGSITRKVTFLGQVLLEQYQPARLVVAGTSGSMWDQLLDQLDEQWSEQQQLTLIERVEAKQVDAGILADLEQALTEASGREVSLVLLPESATPEDQERFFITLCDAIRPGEQLRVDVTHGLRFMPILATACLQYLQHIKGVEIIEMLYGALNGEKGDVYSLNNVLQLAGWTTALSQFDHSGDVSVFAPLLARQGWDQASIGELRRAAFYERINNPSQAANAGRNVLKTRYEGAIAELVQPQLQQRLQWVDQQSRGAREQALARQYLQRRDYLRAVIYAQEGLISSRLYQQKTNEHDFDVREQAHKDLLDESADFKTLTHLRNNLAHGVRSRNAAIQRLQESEQALEQGLNRLFKALCV